jgi:hypothetical protein
MNDETREIMNDNPQDTITPNTTHSSQKGLAIGSLVTGIIAFLTGLAPVWGILAGITAIVLGIFAIRKSAPKAFGIIAIIGGSLAFLTSLATTGLLMYGIFNPSAGSSIDRENRENTQKLLNEKKDYAKGETMLFNGWSLKVNSVEVITDQYQRQLARYGGDQSDKLLDIWLKKYRENDYYIVNITVTNTDIPVEDLPFLMDNAIEMTDGTSNYGMPIAAVDVPEPRFQGKSYEIGESQTAYLLFEVPKSQASLPKKLLVDLTIFLDGAKEQGYAKESDTLRYTLEI